MLGNFLGVVLRADLGDENPLFGAIFVKLSEITIVLFVIFAALAKFFAAATGLFEWAAGGRSLVGVLPAYFAFGVQFLDR